MKKVQSRERRVGVGGGPCAPREQRAIHYTVPSHGIFLCRFPQERRKTEPRRSAEIEAKPPT